jgi:hypothetical protein
MSTVRVIGDCHGNYYGYFKLFSGVDYSIQLGDLGYDYTQLEYVRGIKTGNHVYFPGNHDNHEAYASNCLGRFGKAKVGPLEFFYVGGAFSIDKEIRQKKYYRGEWPKTWFENEELSGQEREQCIKEYSKAKPAVMITHEAPRSIADIIGSPGILRDFGFDPDTFTTVTSTLLQRLYDIHKPETWIFGHYHRKYNAKPFSDTNFICLPELGYIDWTEKSGFLGPS